MPRLRKRLLNAATVASLVLCVATIVLWFRCQDTSSDELEFIWHRGFAVHSFDRCLFFSTFPDPRRGTAKWRPVLQIDRDHRYSFGYWSFLIVYEHGHHAAGLGWGSVDLKDPDAVRPSVRVLMASHGYVALLLALLPAARFARVVARRRRTRPGHCPTCGYDLRATPARCPECGTEAPAVPSS